MLIMTVAEPLVVRSVRPWGGPATDMFLRDGRVAAVGPDLPVPPGTAELSGRRWLAIPSLVDAHAHVDKTTWGTPYRPHSAGPGLASLSANERAVRGTLPAGVAERAGALLDQYVACGTTFTRTHVDVDTEAGLANVEGVLQAASERRDRIGVEVVAFPQSGVLVRPGTAELLEDAVRAGAHLVGGLDPAGFDGDPVGHLDVVFGIAERQGCGVDIHLHDSGELGAWEIELIVERTRALGLSGRVTVSHAFALSSVADARQGELVELLAGSGVAVTTVAPGSRAQLPARLLRDAGVCLGLGNDGVRDLWSPYGNGDMVERAMLLAHACGFRRDEDIEVALRAATTGGAQVCGLAGYGLGKGDRADIVLLPGATPAEAVVSRPRDRTVLKDGRVVSGAPSLR